MPGSLANIITRLGILVSGSDVAPSNPLPVRGSDGSNLIDLATDAVLQAVRDRLPNALVSGRLDVRIGAINAALAAGTNTIGAVTAPSGAQLALDSSLTGISGSPICSGWEAFSNGGAALPAAGAVVKSSPGVIGGFTAVNGTGGAAFIQIHNLAAASGLSTSSIVWRAPTNTASSAVVTTNLLTGGIKCSTGIVIAWSSTQWTYTAVGSNTGNCDVFYK